METPSNVVEHLPTFCYHPDPVASGVFERQDEECPCCLRVRGWVYIGPSFAIEELGSICPWCIASGAAVAKYNPEFVDHYAVEPGATAEALDLLIHRTPSYWKAMYEPWPVHCGDFCTFLRELTPTDIDTLGEEIASELKTFQQNMEIPDEFFAVDLRRDNSPLTAFLFRCLTCGKYRVNGDYE